MAIRALALPSDVPWKRLGASADMIDTSFGDAVFPPKWRSSISVFYHQPEDAPEAYGDRRITYLKITSTITGYQIDQKEIGVEYDLTAKQFRAVPIAIRARGTLADGAYPRMELRVNGGTIAGWDVATADANFKVFVAKADLLRGDNTVEVAFTNDLVDQQGNDRNLFVESVAVGPLVLAATAQGVEYRWRDGNGVTRVTPGQVAMWSQGELVFPVHYVPRDWMSQFVEEYQSLGAYLPCYGALLQLGVFPEQRQLRREQMARVRFSEVAAGNDRPNPLDLRELTIQAAGQPALEIVDRVEMPRALAVTGRTTITLAAVASRVAVSAFGDPHIVLEAYRGNRLVASRSVGLQQTRERTAELAADEIDRIVILTPPGEAFVTSIVVTRFGVADMRPEDFPYVMDFDPKKREMYEVVSETGEVLSRSLNSVNVRKGRTNSESEEIVDIDRGWSFAQAFNYGPIGGSHSFSRQYESGTRNVSTEQRLSEKTTDSLQEARETQAYSTTLSQMYHLFNGYHLGTNRAVFFMLPRPHVTEVVQEGAAARTFANGPRRMEGVQEVFVIVNSPKAVAGLCVEALLETAHLDWTVGQASQVARQPAPPSLSELARFLDTKYRHTSYDYWHDGDKEFYEHFITKVYWNEQAGAFYTEGHRKGETHLYQNWAFRTYEQALEEYYAENPPKEQPPAAPEIHTTMVMTARSLRVCLPDPDAVGETNPPGSVFDSDEWVSFEGDVTVKGSGRTAIDNNLIVDNVGYQMRASLASDRRYPKGAVSLLQSDYAMARLERHIQGMPDDDPWNRPIAELVHIDEGHRAAFSRAFPETRRRKEALKLDAQTIAQKTGLTPAEARLLRAGILGIDLRGARKAGTGRSGTRKPGSGGGRTGDRAADAKGQGTL